MSSRLPILRTIMNRRIKVRDLLLLRGDVTATVIHVYMSGRIKVRLPNGHIKVIERESVVENYGCVPSEEDSVINLLIKK